MRARRLRKGQTDAEILLWRQLRRRSLAGLKFRRQHPVAGFIADFYCEECRLVVELDGGGHAEREQLLRDERRTAELQRLGIRVLRFWNSDVMQNLAGVMQRILEAGRLPPSP